MRKPCQTLPAKSVALQTIAARLLCSAALTLLMPVVANANPQNGKIVAGAANIAQSGSNTLNINQQSQKAIINWQSFNIASGQTTNFNQPNASAITLNRVTGVDPSSIMGNLNANGQIWLINPNGIAFSKSARVDVAGLLATTIDIADQDFLSGNYKFTGLADPNAMVSNAGKITIRDAGLAALVAPGVSNSGVIQADLGQIQLSSAAAFTIDFYGDGLFNFTLDKQVTQAIKNADGTQPAAAVTNTGNLIANGGRIALTANVASSVVSNSINMSGYAQAATAKVSNGQIVLDGGDDGTVEVTGSLDASGTKSRQTGGTVEVTGNSVSLASTAKINASGDADGGTVLIGGAEHGAGSLRNASTTMIAKGAMITADAAGNGNGGQVVVWSNDKTDYQGAVSAKGGSTGGNGGAAEVSSHGVLGFGGTVDLTAAFGTVGSLLLDPQDVTIAASGTEPQLPSSVPGGIEFDPASISSVLSVSTLEGALALADVTVTTGTTGSQSGDIAIAADIGWSGPHSLTLDASRNIIVDPDITIANSGSGNLALHSGFSGSGFGTVTFGTGSKADWSASTGSITLFYNPADNPAASAVNATSYSTPMDFSSNVVMNSAVPAQLTAYMLVNSAYDLQNIQNNLSANYALGTDIEASSTASWNDDAGFIPIGNDIGHFTGVLDGENHKISDLTIKSNIEDVGLFSIDEGSVSRLSLVNESVVSTNTSAYVTVGGLAGSLWLTYVSSVSVQGTVSTAANNYQEIGGLAGYSGDTTIDLSSADVTVTAGSGINNSGQYTAGGLVGSNYGTISRSSASGSVRGDDGEIGGLVGNNHGTITQSFETGSVTGGDVNSQDEGALAGGLVGWNTGYLGSGTILQSYALGNVDAGASGVAGGLIELADERSIVNQTYSTGTVRGEITGGLLDRIGYGGATVSNSYWDLTASDQLNSADGTGLTTSQLKGGLPAGFDSTVWAISSTINTGYPYLQWQTASADTGGVPKVINFGTSSTSPLSPRQSESLAQSQRNILAQIAPLDSSTMIELSAAQAKSEVVSILGDAGWNTADTALTDVLTTFLTKIPQQYLAQAGLDEALGAPFEKEVASTSFLDPYDAASVVLGVWIDVLGDQLSKRYPPVAVEEIKYGLNLSANVVLAEAQYRDPEVALLVADTETTVSELFQTAVAAGKLVGERSSNMSQAQQMDVIADSYRQKASQTSDHKEKLLLLQAAKQEEQAANTLRANASGYSTSSVGSFLESVWQTLVGH